LSVLTYTYLYSIFQDNLPNLSSVLFPYSFYTCRYLHILIYILPSPKYLTPHVLSEWMSRVV
jgi:hypothetical protein